MKARFSTLLAASIVAVTLFAFAPGHADCGDGGSPTNSAGSCEDAGNQVQCGGTETPVSNVSVGANGVEACNSGALPVQGRVGAEGPDCDCIYADGDGDNGSPLNGWVRVDQDGVHCDVDGEQSYNSGAGGDCG